MVTTEFLPPNGFSTLSLARGSGCQLPSTTKRYSWRPGLRLTSRIHLPSRVRSSGVWSGFQPLKLPARNTVLASGLMSSNATTPRASVGAWEGVGGATVDAVGLLSVAFDFFELPGFIVIWFKRNRLLMVSTIFIRPRVKSKERTSSQNVAKPRKLQPFAGCFLRLG